MISDQAIIWILIVAGFLALSALLVFIYYLCNRRLQRRLREARQRAKTERENELLAPTEIDKLPTAEGGRKSLLFKQTDYFVHSIVPPFRWTST